MLPPAATPGPVTRTPVAAAGSVPAIGAAAPAAVRLALPQVDPARYLTPVLGVTFPFNLAIGIPLYHALAARLAG